MSDLEGGLGAGGQSKATPFILVSGLFLLAYWLVAAFVFITDPYDLRPWGARVTVPAHLVTPETRLLAMAVGRSRDFDLVMIGSSTAISYTPDQIKAAFPDAGRPVNFSYDSGRPGDRSFITDSVARYSNAKRVVLWIDWFYLVQADAVVEGWPEYLFDQDVANDLRMVNPKAIEASIGVLNGRPPVENSERYAEWAGRWRQQYLSYQTPRNMKVVMDEYRASVGTLRRDQGRGCEAYETLDRLVPALRTMSERGKSVDLVLPAYSVLFYGSQLGTIGYDFSSLMAFRRCLAQATSGLSGVSIWALDSDIGMITDLGNYKDPGHLYPPQALQSALAGIGDPRYRLTPANVDERNETLWRTVRDYRYTNSYSDPEMSSEP